jgi:hypothetical protein
VITVPFTQYHLPNGRATSEFFDFKDGEIEDEDKFEEKLQRLLDDEVHFDAEILTTGLVSFTAELGEDLLSIQLSENGPSVVKAVESLILEAYQYLVNKNQP